MLVFVLVPWEVTEQTLLRWGIALVKLCCAVGARRISVRRRRRVLGCLGALDVLAEPLSRLVCYANRQLSVRLG